MRTKLTVMLALLCLCGCATFTQNAGKTLATTAATVDAAMQGWATYVVVSQSVPQEQQDQVKAAYEKYQACMATAVASYTGLSGAAGQSAWNQALAALQGAQGTLLQLLQAFTPHQTAKAVVGGAK